MNDTLLRCSVVSFVLIVGSTACRTSLGQETAPVLAVSDSTGVTRVVDSSTNWPDVAKKVLGKDAQAAWRPEGLAMFRKRLYFCSDDIDFPGRHGHELWCFDGRSAYMLADINPGLQDSYPREFVTFMGELYFLADDGEHGDELWKYDGNSVSLVADILPGPDSSDPRPLVVWQDRLYFAADHEELGRELWCYDGTKVSLAADIRKGSGGSYPRELVCVGTKLFFAASDGTHGNELWCYDGQSARLAADISPTDSSYPTHLTAFGKTVCFSAHVPGYGCELWKYDGESASLVADLNSGFCSSYPGGLVVFNGCLFFFAWGDGEEWLNGREGVLWKYDGSSRPTLVVPGPQPITCFLEGPEPCAFPMYCTVFRNKLYFVANYFGHGVELCVCDGRSVSLVADICPGLASSSPGWLTVGEDCLYFVASDDAYGRDLRRYIPPDSNGLMPAD